MGNISRRKQKNITDKSFIKKKKSGEEKNNLSSNIKKSCHYECNFNKKLIPVIMNKHGKNMGLSKGEIKKRIKEYDDNCESNCISIMEDKSLINDIIKGVIHKKERKNKFLSLTI